MIDIKEATEKIKGFTVLEYEAERKTGVWHEIDIMGGIVYATCSICDERSARDFYPEDYSIAEKYCKNCGARMGGNQ